jgi:ribosomal peptide maturation radical SAM protein 1
LTQSGASRPSVILVSMPWAGAGETSIQLGVLKSSLSGAGVSCAAFHLYREFANQVGPELYAKLTGSPALLYLAEWLFSLEAFDLDNADDYLRYLETRMARDLSRCGGGEPSDVLTEVFGPDYRDAIERLRREVVPQFIRTQADRLISTVPFDIAGFSCVFHQLVPSLCLAKALKARNPELRIVLGGSSVQDVMGRECLRAFSWVDFVVDGEGEIALPGLVRHVRERGIPDSPLPPGVWHRSGREVVTTGPSERLADLDRAPVPDYDDYFLTDSNPPRNPSSVAIRFEASRGCWWGEKSHCSFCAVNGPELAYRQKSAERVLLEVVRLATRYRSRHLFSVDSISGPVFLEEVLPKLAALDCDLELFFEVRPDLDKDRLASMRRAGLRRVQPGIESFSTEALKLMRKGTRAIQNVQLLKWCRELNIKTAYHILWGFPGERPDAYAEMAALLPRLFHLDPPDFPPRLIDYQRFSPLFCQTEADRLRPRRDYDYMFPSDTHLPDLAFSFEHPFEEETAGKGYVAPVVDQVRTWRRRYYSSERPFLIYARGIDFVEVWDSRSGAVENAILSGAAAIAFLFCDAIRSNRQIKERVQAQCGGECSDQDVDAALSHLVEKGFLMQEGGSYLALAVAQSSIEGELRFAMEESMGEQE